jgi:hypothetical protein
LTPGHGLARVALASSESGVLMRTTALVVIATAVLSTLLIAQEPKPVPKDSVRVLIPGCTKGYVFTAGPRTAEEPGSVDVPEGMHFRMNGAKKLMAEIKAHEGSMIEITGVIKKGQFKPDGVNVGGGVRIGPGAAPSSGSVAATTTARQIFIDVEGWRPVVGDCRSR